MAYYDAFASCFHADAGRYRLLLGGSSADTPRFADMTLERSVDFRF